MPVHSLWEAGGCCSTGGDMGTCLSALVCEWQNLGCHLGKDGGSRWHTSASSLSVSSSTFTVRMKARCARTWRSASRRYFLQAHGVARGGGGASEPRSAAGCLSPACPKMASSVSPLTISLGSAPQKLAFRESRGPLAEGPSCNPGTGQMNETWGRGGGAGMEDSCRLHG